MKKEKITDEELEEADPLRIKDASTARTIYEECYRNDEQRRKVRSRVRNQLDGGLPYDPGKLSERGEGWRTNVNFRDAESARDRAVQPYWDMANNVPNKISCEIDEETQEKEKLAKIFQDGFDKFLRDWGMDYIIQFRGLTNEYITHGPGFCQWQDNEDPRWEVVSNNDILFPKRTPLSSQKWVYCMVTQEMTVCDLFYKISSEKQKKNSEYLGWNTNNVKKAILSAYKSHNTHIKNDDWVKLQDEIRNNDLGVSEQSHRVEVVHLFVKEHNGKISRFIFTEKGGSENKDDEFLYEKKDEFENFDQVVGTMYWEVGNNQIHGVKGFGIRNHGFSMLSNRMKSLLMDSTNMSLGMNFERQDDSTLEGAVIENFGAINVFPKGLRQITTYPSAKGAMDVMQFLAYNNSENNYQYKQQRDQVAQSNTAKQAEILAEMEAQVSQANSSLFLSQLGESIFKESFRRLRIKGNDNEDAKKFKKRCMDQGMPEEIFHDIEVGVTSGASSSMANSVLRGALYREMLEMSTLPGMNQRYFLENYVANRLGADAVSKAMLPPETPYDIDATNKALMENMHMASGQPFNVDQRHDHEAHITSHLQPMMMLSQQYQETGQIQENQVAMIQNIVPHLEQHFEFLKQDKMKEQAYQQLFRAYQGVANTATAIMANLAKQAQAQQVQPQQ